MSIVWYYKKKRKEMRAYISIKDNKANQFVTRDVKLSSKIYCRSMRIKVRSEYSCKQTIQLSGKLSGTWLQTKKSTTLKWRVCATHPFLSFFEINFFSFSCTVTFLFSFLFLMYVPQVEKKQKFLLALMLPFFTA